MNYIKKALIISKLILIFQLESASIEEILFTKKLKNSYTMFQSDMGIINLYLFENPILNINEGMFTLEKNNLVMCNLNFIPLVNDKIILITLLHTNIQMRNKGFAKFILESAFTTFKKFGVKEINLRVDPQDSQTNKEKLIKFYSGFGFVLEPNDFMSLNINH